ncbi:MAG: transposase [Syntrophothermus sp.]|nr:transposase [Syntrophothermus sp.]
MGNERIPLEQLAKVLARTIIGPRKLALVALDWTDLRDGKHQALVAGIITKGRALPVFWRVVPKAKLTLNQNRIEENFVSALRKILPRDCKVVILADRGFARVTFFQHLERLKFKFVVRTQTKVWVESESFKGTLGTLKIPRGTKRDLGITRYHKAAKWPVRIVVCFDVKQKEPWLLATNVKDEPLSKIVAWYGCRMEVDEFFKDLKNERNGFKLRGLELSSPGRYNRLLLLGLCLFSSHSNRPLGRERRAPLKAYGEH